MWPVTSITWYRQGFPLHFGVGAIRDESCGNHGLSHAGLDTVSVDGQSVQYADVEAKYRYWKREVAREKNQRPQVASINLGGF
jgi:hypothetical protein